MNSEVVRVFDDLSPYNLRIERGHTINIGWLGHDRPYTTGSVPDAFLARLEELVTYAATNVMRAQSYCELASDGACVTMSEIRAIGSDGARYAAPSLIHHYVTAHGYRPPDAFIEAVMRAELPDWSTARATDRCLSCGSTLKRTSSGYFVSGPERTPVIVVTFDCASCESSYSRSRPVPEDHVRTARAFAALRTSADRAEVLPSRSGVVVALADGAGGVAEGPRAATAWIDLVNESVDSGTPWTEVIEKLDADPSRRGSGQTTAIVVEITDDEIRGACVGDSALWLVTDDEVIDLAEHVPPKPLVGDGCIASEIVARRFTTGTLLLASDGLVKYTSRARIAQIARGDDLDAAAKALVELVRLPSGRVPDDVTVVLCRR